MAILLGIFAYILTVLGLLSIVGASRRAQERCLHDDRATAGRRLGRVDEKRSISRRRVPAEKPLRL